MATIRSLPTALVIAMLPLVGLLAACGSEGEGPPESPRGGDGSATLVAFDSCQPLLDRLVSNPGSLSSGGVPAGALPSTVESAATAEDAGGAELRQTTSDPVGSGATGTNIQEVGVDEPDRVKTDGETIFSLAGRTLHATSAESTPDTLGSLELPGKRIGAGGNDEMLLFEDKILVLTERTRMSPRYRLQTVLLEIDANDPANLSVDRRVILDGSYLSARLVGSTVRLALSSTPDYPIELSPAEVDGAEGVQARVEDGAADSSAEWLPQVIVRAGGERSSEGFLSCDQVRAPKDFAGSGMLSVSTIDLAEGIEVSDTDAVMADGETVYASADSLYVATNGWSGARTDVAFNSEPSGSSGIIGTLVGELLPATDDEPVAPAPIAAETEIHRFDTSAEGETTYVGSGKVEGTLLNQYSISEYEGHLRVATTLPSGAGDAIPPGTDSQNMVTAFELVEDGLSQSGEVDGLGFGEEIKAVRFVGDLGFVVTFRQTDPLYAIDLSDPADPEVRGELKIPGYSAYLHPVGDDRLLGVGQDADPKTGITEGTQVSLFDVSDLEDPERVAKLSAGEATSSAVEFDARAFTYWPSERLAVIPVRAGINGRTLPAEDSANGLGPNAALVYEVSTDGELSERGRITHADGNQPIDRSLAIGDRLFAISDIGVSAAEVNDGEVSDANFSAYR